MDVTLPLDQMTIEDKIRTMEILWDDLCRQAEGRPSPAWHGEILRERERMGDFDDYPDAIKGFKAYIEKKEYGTLVRIRE